MTHHKLGELVVLLRVYSQKFDRGRSSFLMESGTEIFSWLHVDIHDLDCSICKRIICICAAIQNPRLFSVDLFRRLLSIKDDVAPGILRVWKL